MARTGHPLLILYEHYMTRRYINADAAGDVWRYVASRKFSDQTPGTYMKIANVDEALEGLGLDKMPWMDPNRFGRLQGEETWRQESREDG